MEIKYEKLSEEDRKELEELYFTSVTRDFRRGMIEEDCYNYEVVLQDDTFRTAMSDDELKQCIGLSLDILEELKEINNKGTDRAALDKIENSMEDTNRMSRIMKVYHEFCTDRIHLIMAELNQVRRVGGAYAMLLANPLMSSAIYAVFDKLVDNFDDDALYCHSGYFLLRAAMKMNSVPVNE